MAGGVSTGAGTAKNAGKLTPALSAFVGALGALGFSWLVFAALLAGLVFRRGFR